RVSDVCDLVALPFSELDSDEDPGRCQRNCIEGVVGDCYSDCGDKCEGDQLALKLCRRACRDARCNSLQARCIRDDSDDENHFTAYEVCCERPNGNCLEEVDCEVTTTNTTTSTTSTSTTSTTTTAASTTTTLARAASAR